MSLRFVILLSWAVSSSSLHFIHTKNNRADDALQAAKDYGPRILITQDCSGSTFVQHTAIELLRAHGLNIYFTGTYESLKPQKNVLYQKSPKKGMADAMATYASRAQKSGGVLVFKAEPNKLENDPSIASAMVKYSAHAAHVYRSNVLDQAICKVRDCFPQHFGVAVDQFGSPSSACFKRRSDGKVIEKAHLKAEQLVQFVNETMQRQIHLPAEILAWGFPRTESVAYEDLAAFQYGATDYNSCDLACSLRAWCRLLMSWDVAVDSGVVESYLLNVVKTETVHKPPGRHIETIDNLHEVYEAFVKAGPEFVQLMRL